MNPDEEIKPGIPPGRSDRSADGAARRGRRSRGSARRGSGRSADRKGSARIGEIVVVSPGEPGSEKMPGGLPCEVVAPLLLDLVLDQCDAEIGERVDEHVDGCESCHQLSIAIWAATDPELRDALNPAH